jgi:class 3 adenylate cyclase/Flp pilus assembly protein TadD
MTFEEILDHAIAMLQRRGRLTYGTLKRQFELDDAALEDLKNELIEGQRLAVDERGNVLVWTGTEVSAPHPPTPPASSQDRPPLAYTPQYLAEKVLHTRSAMEGERKQVTVLFADLKGSMELLADRDPEEARHLLDPVLERLMAAVHRYEGTVNQVMGDGIMALFGAPLAHEDHAVRACYAALAMQEAIRHYSAEVRRTHGIEVQIRVGLNSGEVVVRAIGNDLHMDYSAIGQTTHMAARMEQLATPGSVRLTAETLRLAEGLIQVTALGPVPVRGLADPVEVFELVGASTVRRRFQAAVARGLTRFVGRQMELEALQQALARAATGHGHIVAMVGEAGVGKSRLVYEFVHWRDCVGAGRSPSHRLMGWRVLESASVSYGKATPYFPVLDLLKRYVHVEESDDLRTIRAKVTGQVLTLDEALQEIIPALLSLLDALPDDSSFLKLDPSQRRQRILEALKRLLLRESQVQPLLLVFEDLHWIDAETQALLDSLVESLPTARLLLLVNYRPEYQHAWGSTTSYTQLRLDLLPPASADALLQALVGDDPSLAPLTRLLIARTEGNPFFLEESVRTLVETGALAGAPGAYRLAQALPTIQVPATVQAVLAARIDRLSPEDKRLLQTAAVIGTEVPFPLLQATGELPEEALHRGLDHLQAAELLYETRLFPEREYTFKHALTHEVTYGGLLQERRRVLHGRIVEVLEALAAERLAEQIERLAQHALRGEVWAKAVTYCWQAGTKAAGHSAYREAVTYIEQALEALPHLPESRETLEQAIDLRLDLRQAFFALTAHRSMLNPLREAEVLAETLGDQRRLGHVSTYLSQYYWAMGDQERALVAGQRALACAERFVDVPLQGITTIYLSQACFTLGELQQGIAYIRRSVASFEGEQRWERCGLPYLPSVFSRQILCVELATVGAFAESIAVGEEGVQIAEATDHPLSCILACIGIGFPSFYQGDLHRAIPILERALALCQAANIPPWPIFTSSLGAAYTLSGRVTEALPLLEQAVAHANTVGLLANQPLFIANLSQGYLRTGRWEEATQSAQRALELARAHRSRVWEAHALHVLGDIAMHRDPPDLEQAEDHSRQALALADELGMRPLQAHCHRGLGTLYATTGQHEQARATLSTAIELYHAMEMQFWLPQAEATLAQVR